MEISLFILAEKSRFSKMSQVKGTELKMSEVKENSIQSIERFPFWVSTFISKIKLFGFMNDNTCADWMEVCVWGGGEFMSFFPN